MTNSFTEVQITLSAETNHLNELLAFLCACLTVSPALVNVSFDVDASSPMFRDLFGELLIGVAHIRQERSQLVHHCRSTNAIISWLRIQSQARLTWTRTHRLGLQPRHSLLPRSHRE